MYTCIHVLGSNCQQERPSLDGSLNYGKLAWAGILCEWLYIGSTSVQWWWVESSVSHWVLYDKAKIEGTITQDYFIPCACICILKVCSAIVCLWMNSWSVWMMFLWLRTCTNLWVSLQPTLPPIPEVRKTSRTSLIQTFHRLELHTSTHTHSLYLCIL